VPDLEQDPHPTALITALTGLFLHGEVPLPPGPDPGHRQDTSLPRGGSNEPALPPFAEWWDLELESHLRPKRDAHGRAHRPSHGWGAVNPQ
jgi:hypothetical protein